MIDDAAARGLVEEIARGNQQALIAFYRAFSRDVYAFALRRLSNAGEADEIVPEVMYEVWRHAGRFAGQSKASTWLLGIARHKVLDRLRGRQRERHEDVDELADELPAEGPGAFERLAGRQDAALVARCLERLPAEQRECVHLVFYQGLGLAEIAALQGCPENTVKTRVFHARRKLKDCLSALLGGKDDG